MDLERVSVALRPRTSWEAIDLGLQLVRKFAPSVFVAWWAVFIPCAILIHGVLYSEPAIAFVVVWWLRPFFDRAVLSVLGPAVFGAAPGPREILTRWPAFISGLFRAPVQLLASLTWRRFSPWRSYVLPVDVLEMLPLGARRERVAVLARTHRDVATGLTLVCIALEITLYFAMLVFISLLIPQAYNFDIWAWLFDSESIWARVAQVILLGLAHSVVEPIYVSGGFGLYLNRRIELEGWDLELSFRRLASRRSRNGVATAVALCLLGFFTLPARAQSPQSHQRDPQEVVQRVLSSEQFSDFDEEWVWRWKRSESEVEERETSESPDLEMFEIFGKAFAKLFFVVGLIALVVVAVLILRALFRQNIGRAQRGAGREGTPATLFGLDLDEASLPTDIIGAARAAWPERPRLAFSLLYRGALAHLVHIRGLRISESATEGECVWIVNGQMPDLAPDFEALTRVWQRLAYGRRVPEDRVFLDLLGRWEAILRPRSEEAA